MGQQRIIGLTGGIATGKSTVSRYLQDTHNIPVLDADIYARQAVAPGSPILQTIIHRYGDAILGPDGELDRSHLGQIVFQHQAERTWLEQQIHPHVRQCFVEAMTTLAHSPIVVQSIPLLFEANLTDQVTEIWVVVCSPQQQQQRLIARNHLSPEQAEARIQSQMPLDTKAAQANVVLDNSGDLAYLFRQIEAALQNHP